jgi:ABC-2 type transport system permease protein
MQSLLAHFRIVLRLSARNRVALAYGYLFPVTFLVSFLVLYRREHPLLVRHMGELLTVAILSGACFGLPALLVSERERGIWRRYRLAPVPIGTLVAATLLSRAAFIAGAVLLQLGLAMAIGRWVPTHPLQLLVACSLVTGALVGLGLVLASIAETVLAAQALGQCVFLPMLVIGGVAVQIENLPAWVLPVTAFLPGRYAVVIIQACVSGDGLRPFGFPIVALLVTGAAGCLAGSSLFRWDSGARRLSIGQRLSIATALASWVIVGGLAVGRHELGPRREEASLQTSNVELRTSKLGSAPGTFAAPAVSELKPAPPSPDSAGSSSAATPPSPKTASVEPPPPPSQPSKSAEPWRALTTFDFAALPIGQMPADDGDISPIASDDQVPLGNSVTLLKRVVDALPAWKPGHTGDRVQRVRNYLLLLGVADYAQSPIERFLPAAVLTQMLEEFPPEELAQLVCWVALHSDEGNLDALADPLLIELGAKTLNRDELRTRTYYYGVKLTRRIVGF